MSKRRMILLGAGAYVGLMIVLYLVFGSQGKNEEFEPVEEFRLTPWIHIKIGGLDLSINKGVFYLFLASALTVGTMIWIARRMQAKPNRVQTIIEVAYDLTYNNITRGNMDAERAVRWFPFIATLFLFIWFSNILGYLPLPLNTTEKINVLGLQLPAFTIYAATANLSIPLVLTLIVWFSYHVEGIRAKGFRGYFRSWIPSGTPRALMPLIVPIEVISQFVRIISLSVRLFANILSGHLLLLFMGGGLAVLLGLSLLGVATLPLAFAFFLFEVGLVATLQAFIFATLTSIYIGEATAAHGH
jgi:F-type H+-transporting ATPase subunit a